MGVVEKGVRSVQLEPIERCVEVPVLLQREVPVPVPQQQTVDLIKQVPEPMTQNVATENPQAASNYAAVEVPVTMAQGRCVMGEHAVGKSVFDSGVFFDSGIFSAS